MKIPYVIDNQRYRLADVLRELLAGHAGKSLDVATAYFTVGAFGMLREGLGTLGNFRMLLGADPRSAEQIGLRPEACALAARICGDIEREPFSEVTLPARFSLPMSTLSTLRFGPAVRSARGRCRVYLRRRRSALRWCVPYFGARIHTVCRFSRQLT